MVGIMGHMFPITPERTVMELTPEQKLNALKIVLLAIEELVRRQGVATEYDAEDPDASVDALRLLSQQYGGKRISLEVIDAVIATPISALFPEFLNQADIEGSDRPGDAEAVP